MFEGRQSYLSSFNNDDFQGTNKNYYKCAEINSMSRSSQSAQDYLIINSELKQEIENKEYDIKILRQQLEGYEKTKKLVENLKSKLHYFEDSQGILEDESKAKIGFLNEQLRQLSDQEMKLRNQLISKDKVIHDFDKTIKDLEAQNALLKKQAFEKETVNIGLRQDLNETALSVKNLIQKLKCKEDETISFQNNHEDKYKELEEEKNKLEDKLTQIVEIVKQQSKELFGINAELQGSEKEKHSLQKQLQKIKQDLEESLALKDGLALENVKYKEATQRLREKESQCHDLELKLKEEINKNTRLNKQFDEQAQNLYQYQVKYSGENTLENLKNQLSTKDNEIYSLTNSNLSLSKSNKQLETKLRETEEDLKDVVSGINSELNIITQWIETYLGVYFDKSIEIPDLPVTFNKVIKSNFKLEKLKETLLLARRNINSELGKVDNGIIEMKNDLSQSIARQEKMIKEISDLKSENLSKGEEIYKLNSELKNIHFSNHHSKDSISKIRMEYEEKIRRINSFCENIYTLTNNALDKLKSNKNILAQYPENLYSQLYSDSIQDKIQNNIEKILSVINNIIMNEQIFDQRSYQPQFNQQQTTLTINQANDTLNTERNKVLEENNNLKEEIRSFKDEIKELNDQIVGLKKQQSKLTEENEILNAKINESIEDKTRLLNDLENMDKESKFLLDQLEKYKEIEIASKNHDLQTLEKFEQLNDKIKQLEKRCGNYIRDIELKDIQIKSQEKMIIRRTNEIEQMKMRSGTDLSADEGGKSQLSSLLEKVRSLESINQNLVNDNILLKESKNP